MKFLQSIKLSLIALVAILSFNACKSKKSVADNVTNPNQFESYYIDACAQYNIGNYTVALQKFNACANLKPQEASVYYQLSRTNNFLKNYNEALFNASKANKLAPENKFYALHYAHYLKQIGQYKDGINVLETSLKSNLKDEPTYAELVNLYDVGEKNTDKQIALWKQYLEQAGFKTNIALKLIKLYNDKKDYEGAHNIYNQLKKAAPKKAQFYIEDAAIYQLQKDETNAMLNYEKAMEINPNNWQVNYALYQYYFGKNDDTKAKKYFEQAFNDANTTFETKTKACQDLLKNIDNKTINSQYAEIAAKALISIYPANANAQYTAATFYEKINKQNEAQLAYENSTKLNANMYDAWLGAIKIASLQKNYQKTIELSEKAIEYFPNIALLYYYVANGNNNLLQHNKANEFAVNGLRYVIEDKDKVLLLIEKSIALYKLQKYTEAQNSALEAKALPIENAQLFDILGNIYFKLNEPTKALENWQQAKTMGLKNEWIDKKIADKKLYE